MIEFLKTNNIHRDEKYLQVFILCVAELLLPYYQRFCRDSDAHCSSTLKDALDAMWTALIGGGSLGSTVHSSEFFYSMAPDSEDFESYYTMRAMHSCATIGNIIERWHEGKAVEISDAVGYLVEALQDTDGRFGMNADELREYSAVRDIIISGLIRCFYVALSESKLGLPAIAKELAGVFRSDRWLRDALLL